MNRRYISGFLGIVVVLACVVGLSGTAMALEPIQGVYDPNNPLEFMLACCQWELMKKIELTLLGQAPDERFYTPELAALDIIPQILPQVQSYEASSSCCGQYAQAQAQADQDIAVVGAQYQAWKAAQAADVQSYRVNETPVDTKSLDFSEAELAVEQFLTTNDTPIDVQKTQVPLVVDALETHAGDVLKDPKKLADEKMCEACAEAQQFAEWLFSSPKDITS
ncbi:MAG: hypothetical protein LBV40_08180 [Methanomicrobiales archaeon]|nr:hypothetical protein [Methanomicrobiales archaeon]